MIDLISDEERLYNKQNTQSTLTGVSNLTFIHKFICYVATARPWIGLKHENVAFQELVSFLINKPVVHLD